MQDLIKELNEHRQILKGSIEAKRQFGWKLANAEFEYRKERSKMIAKLNIVGYEAEDGKMKPLAITTCESMSHGIEPVASLRLKRDLLQIDCDSIQEKIYQTKLEIGIIERQIQAERNGL